MTQKKVAVVAGVGPGNGAALARRFADAGYAVALLARSQESLTPLEAEISGARGYPCDVGSDADVARVFAAIRADLGEVDVLLYNAGSGLWGDVETITPDDFEQSWRVNAYGALLCSREVIPAMKTAGEGAIVFIGATASRRGGPNSAAFAPAKAAQRSLAESMARSLWPSGIHVCLIVVDGFIDLPRSAARCPTSPTTSSSSPRASPRRRINSRSRIPVHGVLKSKHGHSASGGSKANRIADGVISRRVKAGHWTGATSRGALERPYGAGW